LPELRKGPDHWPLGDYFHGPRKATDGFSARERGAKRSKELPLLPRERVEDAERGSCYGRNGGSPNTPGWSIRVVPNKFPALGIEGDLDKEGEGLFDKMNGIGAHEVIIESPDHSATLATLSERSLEDLLWSYRDRMLDLKNDKRFRYVLISRTTGKQRARPWNIHIHNSSRCPSCHAEYAKKWTTAGITTMKRSAAFSATLCGKNGKRASG